MGCSGCGLGVNITISVYDPIKSTISFIIIRLHGGSNLDL